jgi:hypothetical protein
MPKKNQMIRKVPPFVVEAGGPMSWVFGVTPDYVLLVPDSSIQFSEQQVTCKQYYIDDLEALLRDRELYPAWDQTVANNMSALAHDSHMVGQHDAKEGHVVIRTDSEVDADLDTASLDDIKLPTAGENWIEHDLEKAGSAEA